MCHLSFRARHSNLLVLLAEICQRFAREIHIHGLSLQQDATFLHREHVRRLEESHRGKPNRGQKGQFQAGLVLVDHRTVEAYRRHVPAGRVEKEASVPRRRGSVADGRVSRKADWALGSSATADWTPSTTSDWPS